jgi:hypothetical protein
MKHIRKFNEGFGNFFKSKEQIKKIDIGDKVMVISLEGNPIGEVYDISGNSYWVDLENFGKMEFSDFDLKVLV